MVNNKLVDITGLTRYHDKLKGILSTKQDKISDLDTIRENASAGAAALESAKSYVDGKVDGKFDAAGSAAQALADAKVDAAEKYQVKGNYEAAGAAAQALADAKVDAAEKYQVKGDYEKAGTAAQALLAAQAYTDEEIADLVNTYDSKGSAATALTDAKTEMANRGLVEGKVLGTAAYADTTAFDAAGTAAGLNTAMDTRVKVLEAIDHTQLAADASAAAVATILDGAPESFDTLKEVAQWISDSESAASAADLVTRVAALEAIDHDAYVAADAQVLADAKAYTDGKVDGKFDAVGSAAAAETAAKSYADSLASNYDAAGSAATALSDAKAYVDGKGYATTAQVEAKEDKIEDLDVIRTGAAAGATALQASDLQFATDDDIDGLFV